MGTKVRPQPCGAEFSHILSVSFELTSWCWLQCIPGTVFLCIWARGYVSARQKQARDEEIMLSQQAQGVWSGIEKNCPCGFRAEREAEPIWAGIQAKPTCEHSLAHELRFRDENGSLGLPSHHCSSGVTGKKFLSFQPNPTVAWEAFCFVVSSLLNLWPVCSLGLEWLVKLRDT